MEQIPEYIHPSWHQYLQPLFDDKKILMLKNQTLPRCKFYPESDKIFRVFTMPLENVKVVILGQDPYYNGTANGYAFAVNQSTPLPKSLAVIKKEIIDTKTDLDAQTDINGLKWKTLEHWAEQGVFLLNTALTVELGNAGSHTGQWQWFTKEIVRVLSTERKPIWMLWGAKAKSFKDYIYKPKFVVTDIESPLVIENKESNLILEADHPASGSYPGSKYNFAGCNHFNMCNALLKVQGKTIINW